MDVLYPVTQKFVNKHGILYPVTHSFVKKSVEIPPEPFSITVNSGSDRSFLLPTSGKLNGSYQIYDWIVDWGDGGTQVRKGTGSIGTGISHTFPQANTLYTIKIKPIYKDELGWMRAFGFDTATTVGDVNSYVNKIKILQINGQLTEQMIRTSDDDSNVCACMFFECPNITMGNAFQLPQNLTKVGNGFCASMFYGTSITMNDIFQLPQELKTVGSSFCSSMFFGARSFTVNQIFRLPQGIVSVGGGFCSNMFTALYGNREVAINLDQFFSSLVLSQDELDKNGVYDSTFYRCQGITGNLANIPQLQMIPRGSKNTFEGCPAELIAPLHANWK